MRGQTCRFQGSGRGKCSAFLLTCASGSNLSPTEAADSTARSTMSFVCEQKVRIITSSLVSIMSYKVDGRSVQTTPPTFGSDSSQSKERGELTSSRALSLFPYPISREHARVSRHLGQRPTAAPRGQTSSQLFR